MIALPKEVMDMINDQGAMKALATVSSDGKVHAIRVGSAVAPDANMIAVGAILMERTSSNLEFMKGKGFLASVLLSKEMESYEVKGKVKDYMTSGPLYDRMAEEIKRLGLNLKGVWTIEPVEVWNQSASYEAGKRIA